MQITGLAPQTPAAAPTPSRPPAERPPEGPADLFAPSTLRTAEQVLGLPVMDPVFQLGLAMGTLAAMMGGSGGPGPVVTLTLASHLANSGAQAEYRLDMEDPETPVTGKGSVDGQPVQETARLEQGSLLWHGTVGSDQVDLHLAVDESRESLTMKGQCGAVPADLTVSLLSGETVPFQGIRTTGKLDGKAYSVDALIKDPAGGLRKGSEPGHLQVRGHFDGDLIHRDYDVTVEPSASGFALKATGGGIVAGTVQSMDIEVKVSDRG